RSKLIERLLRKIRLFKRHLFISYCIASIVRFWPKADTFQQHKLRVSAAKFSRKLMCVFKFFARNTTVTIDIEFLEALFESCSLNFIRRQITIMIDIQSEEVGHRR